MKVFIDTSVYIALMVSSEVMHARVTKAFRRCLEQRAAFFTSDYVLDELYTRLAYDQRPLVVRRCVRIIEQAADAGELNVLRVDDAAFSAAQKLFLKYLDHRLSFTDATSIGLMKTFKLDEIFTLDKDFRRARVPMVTV